VLLPLIGRRDWHSAAVRPRVAHLRNTWILVAGLLIAAVAVETVASVLIYRARAFGKKPQTPQGYFILRCVLPSAWQGDFWPRQALDSICRGGAGSKRRRAT